MSGELFCNLCPTGIDEKCSMRECGHLLCKQCARSLDRPAYDVLNVTRDNKSRCPVCRVATEYMSTHSPAIQRVFERISSLGCLVPSNTDSKSLDMSSSDLSMIVSLMHNLVHLYSDQRGILYEKQMQGHGAQATYTFVVHDLMAQKIGRAHV